MLIGVSLFALAPLTVGAFWPGFPFGGGDASQADHSKFPGRLCPSTITAAGVSVPVYLPCKKDTSPTPRDLCPHVPGKQTSTPCADELCEDDGGEWDGNSCEYPPEEHEPTLVFSANPISITAGASTTLQWDSTDADTCTASNGWSGSKAVDGSQAVSPTATTTYTLTCENEDGEVAKSVTVGVVSAAPQPESPTLTFGAALGILNEGATTTLSWDSTNATSCTASAGWGGSKAVDGSEVVGPTATTTYTLTCAGSGGSVEKSVTINVIPKQAPPPEGKLLITEVIYDLGTGQGSEPANEWVEIYNGTNSSVNLGNYSMADASTTDQLPSVVVPAGSYAVIVASSTTASFWSIPGAAVVAQLDSATIGNGLGNTGDMIALIANTASTTVDAVSWGNNTTAFSPGVATVASGHSLARTSVSVDTNTAADWKDQETPTPGQ